VTAPFEVDTRREWLETNGIGGFASSTVIGMNTRRYHGLLVAATQPPLGRMVLLSKMEGTAIVNGRHFDLSCNRYGLSAYGERRLHGRFSLGSGYAQLDRRGLYSDRFNLGRRLFWNSHLALNRDWSIMALATYALSGSPLTATRSRFDIVVGYNLLHRLQSAGIF
jgi:hypothetical protein